MKHTTRLFAGVMIGLILAACGINAAERNNAGNRYTERGEYDQALSAYQVALVAEPENAVIYFNAAAAYAGQEAIEDAVQTLEQAIRRGDDALVVDAYFNLGNLFYEAERCEEAAMAYQNGLLLDDTDDDMRFNLELALGCIETPTPEPVEMQSQPDDQQADPSITPTPNPGALDQPTPTPPPLDQPPAENEEENPVVEEQNPGGEPSEDIPPEPQPLGTLSIEQAERILEEVEFEQEGLGGAPTALPRQSATPFLGKDW